MTPDAAAEDARFDESLRAQVPALGAGLALIFLTFAVLAVALQPADTRHGVFLANALAALVMAGVALLAKLRPPRHGHAWIFALLLVAIANVSLGYAVEGSALQGVYYGVVLLCAGAFLVDRRWLLASVATVGAAFTALLALRAPPGDRMEIALVVLGCALLALLLREARHGVLLELQAQRRESDRLRHEATDRARELQGFLDAVPFGVYRSTPDGRLLLSNPAVETILGYTRDQLAALDLEHDAPSQHPRALFKAQMEEHGEVQNLESVWVRADGRHIWVRESARVVRDADGRTLYYEGTIEDVTQLRRAEDVLRRNDRLAALGTLVAGVAHEINNPLTYVRGNVELAIAELAEVRERVTADDADLIEGVIRQQRTVLSGVDRLAAIAKGLKIVARSPNGERRPESLDALVEDVLAIFTSRVKDDVTLDLHLECDGRVLANAPEMSQVVLNLLLNAADAVAGAPAPLIRVRTRIEAGHAVLEVRDNGRGVPAEVADRLFTPFFTTKSQGTGLGLSISHAIVADHGGVLATEPSTGGAVFSMRLPLLEAQPPASRSRSPVTAAANASASSAVL